jgi:dihydrofolate reductase
MISIIVAFDKNRVIGARGMGLLWRLPADLKHFKELTMGHTVIIGRKTYESIGKSLPGRMNIIITRRENYSALGCMVAGSLKEAVDKAGNREVFVIGGGEIYKEALPIAQRLYVTLIEYEFTGDVYFPEIDTAKWKMIYEKPGFVDEKNAYPHRFLVFERIV